jgi:prepilin-type processing-associated H-X9-DG protein
LVELLVVVGIIVILIALLLPALTGARDAANRAKCLATLRSMHQAAYMHAMDHHGYMPVGGAQSPSHLGVWATDVGLGDPNRRRYFYYHDHEHWRPEPLPLPLARYMGINKILGAGGPGSLQRLMTTDAVRSRFTCPAEDLDTAYPGYTLSDGTYGDVPASRGVYMSYVFNGAFLGRQIADWGETPAGRLAAVRRPTIVFLFADGNSGPGGDPGRLFIGGARSTTDTLYHGVANRKHLDYARHRGRINVMFVDGHAETLMLPPKRHHPNESKGDLGNVGLTWGIFE